MNVCPGKLPGASTGIEIRHTTCDICSPQHHCGVSAYVKDGRLIKTEGWAEHPYSKGQICTKGAAYKDYLYRPDRILTPLRRAGKRGEGRFVPISWEEAYAEIAENLNRIKHDYGPQQVMFMNGYGKWCKTFLTRFAFSFGSPNVVADGCTCQTATHLAWEVETGTLTDVDLDNAKTFLGWAFNPYYSNSPLVPHLLKLKRRGLKIVIIDSKVTPAATNLADIFLQIRQGTDGALAAGMAKLLIENGWIDREYIAAHVHGYEEYAAYVCSLSLEEIAETTGIPAEKIYEVTKLYATNGPACIRETACTLTQNINGFQTYRAINALNALTGNYDRKGGCYPIFYTYNHRYAGYETREHEFMMSRLPPIPRMGTDRFPLWNLYSETMGNELAAYIAGEKMYPIRAIFGMGMNYRMFPQPDKIKKAIVEQLDFFALTDIFLTDTAKLADIVLPACTSYERSEFRCYPNGLAYYSKPVVDRVGESKSDLEILSELAPRLDHNDALLNRGYEAWIDYILQDTGWTVDRLKREELPVRVDNYRPYVFGSYTKSGYKTPTGKFEIHATLLDPYVKSHGYSPIPTVEPPLTEEEREAFPFVLTSGVRVPNSLNSRLHDVANLRALRPEPVAELNDEQAEEMGIRAGDPVRVSNAQGSIRLKALPTARIVRNTVQVFHDYREADVNTLMDENRLDPYTGFPGYRTVPCRVEKEETP